MYHFITNASPKQVATEINRQRALDLLYDTDRVAIGLPPSPRDSETERCILWIFGESRHKKQGPKPEKVENFLALETSVLAWFLNLSTLEGFRSVDIVDKSKAPWSFSPRKEDILYSTKMHDELAMKVIPFDERCKLRAYDIAFIVYMNVTQQKVSVANMKQAMSSFYAWMNTDAGKSKFQEAFEMCADKLQRA